MRQRRGVALNATQEWINPITWTGSETLATTDEGLGPIMPNPSTVALELVPQYADAQIDL